MNRSLNLLRNVLAVTCIALVTGTLALSVTLWHEAAAQLAARLDAVGRSTYLVELSEDNMVLPAELEAEL